MASFSVAGYKSPGQTFTVTNASKPANTDTLTLSGIKKTIAEWTRGGVIQYVSTVSTTHTYLLQSDPTILGSQPSGDYTSSSEKAPEYMAVIITAPDTGRTVAAVASNDFGNIPGYFFWGDTASDKAVDGTKSHTYAADGTYTITYTNLNGVVLGTLEVTVAA